MNRARKASSAKEQRPNGTVKAGEAVKLADFGQVVAPKAEVQEQFRKSHAHIKDEIVDGQPPAKEIDILTDMTVSRIALGEYVTLDWEHYQAIRNLIRVIQDYTKDPTRPRPLNIIMHAEPGSGKSHFIKSLAKHMRQDGVKEVTFNMSSVRSVDDFVQPLEEVRNLKVVDKIPLLFLDEFDSTKSNYPLLLPLLWDGELSVGQRRLRIGKVVIVLAGSGKEIDKEMTRSKEMKPTSDDETGKLPDLLSRINGGEFKIPDLDEVSSPTKSHPIARDRRVDKVCLTVALLLQRFPSLSTVPWAFLRFIAETQFRYGVRSISHLIDLIPATDKKKTTLEMEDLKLPLDSAPQLNGTSLAIHLLAPYGPASVIETWTRFRSQQVPVRFKRSLDSLSFTDILRKYFEDK